MRAMLRLAVVVSMTLGLGVSGGALATVRTQIYKTPAQMETDWLGRKIPGGSFLQLGHVRYGPVKSVACRGDGVSRPTATGLAYPRMICVLRVTNDDRMLEIRTYDDGTYTRFEFLR